MSSPGSPATDGGPRRQRIAAYAVVLRGPEDDPQVLMTRMSSRTRIVGRWTLPGGGIDHGEDPRDAVRREVFEETGLVVEPLGVVDVHSVHFTGERPDGLVEDYHGIHLIFDARLSAGSQDVEPHVVELDSSTDLAAWMSVPDAIALDLLGAARHALQLVLERHMAVPRPNV